MLSTGASSQASVDDVIQQQNQDPHNAGSSSQNQLGQSNPNPQISFSNIVDFLKEHQRQTYSRETEWLFEKSQMQQRIH